MKDLTLADTADQLGVSVGELMRGVETGRFSEYVTKDDVVKSGKGDPQFFRVSDLQAMSICGADYQEVTTDMTTVEQMPEMGEIEDRKNGDTPVLKLTSPSGQSTKSPATTSTDSQSTTPERPKGDQRSRGSGGLFDFFLYGAAIGGVAALASVLFGEDDSGWTERELRFVYTQGWNARSRGEGGNPYLASPKAAETYRQGWWDADEKIPHQIERDKAVRISDSMS